MFLVSNNDWYNFEYIFLFILCRLLVFYTTNNSFDKNYEHWSDIDERELMVILDRYDPN